MALPSEEDILDEIFDAVATADRPRALALASRAHQAGIGHPLILVLAAEQLESEGKTGAALELLSRAAAAAPGEPEPWRRAAALLQRLERYTEALQAFERALEVAPDADELLAATGAASLRLGDLAKAEICYTRAVAVSPKNPAHLAALAAVLIRRQRPSDARPYAERALALDPHHLASHLALCRIELAERALTPALERVNVLAARQNLDESARLAVLDLRAQIFDSRNQIEDAMSDYSARNQLIARRHAGRFGESSRQGRISQARMLLQNFAETSPDGWRQVHDDEPLVGDLPAGHAFIVGFPRSGTTLLEKVLASHPAVLSLEEDDFISPIGAPWIADTAALAGLSQITIETSAAGRYAYWQAVRAHFAREGKTLSGKVLIDKLPLHTLMLPVIAKLFPRAPILFALRDPRDVVLSCFRRRFEINAAMFALLTLEGAAEYYDQVMALATIYRARLPLYIREIRHESLVTNFEDEARSVLHFLRLEWDPAVLNFSERARQRSRTPSDEQLAGGLRADGMGQWRRYAKQMSPVLPRLRPWVERFNYPPE